MSFDADDYIASVPESNYELEVERMNSDVEFFECQKCGEINVLKNTPKKRRNKVSRHMRLDNVTWGSLRRFQRINNVDMNYAILLLLMNAKTPNIDYVLNPRMFVDKKSKPNT